MDTEKLSTLFLIYSSVFLFEGGCTMLRVKFVNIHLPIMRVFIFLITFFFPYSYLLTRLICATKTSATVFVELTKSINYYNLNDGLAQ